jgi:AraC-like DNA-binding protein
VEVLGRYSNPGSQTDRLRKLAQLPPVRKHPRRSKRVKQVQHRLSKPAVMELVAAYQEGITVADLADRYRISRTTLMKHIVRAGAPRRWRKLSQSDIEQAKHMYASGLSLVQLGEHFGVNRSTVQYAFRKVGFVLRDSHGRERAGPDRLLASPPSYQDPPGNFK